MIEPPRDLADLPLYEFYTRVVDSINSMQMEMITHSNQLESVGNELEHNEAINQHFQYAESLHSIMRDLYYGANHHQPYDEMMMMYQQCVDEYQVYSSNWVWVVQMIGGPHYGELMSSPLTPTTSYKSHDYNDFYFYDDASSTYGTTPSTLSLRSDRSSIISIQDSIEIPPKSPQRKLRFAVDQIPSRPKTPLVTAEEHKRKSALMDQLQPMVQQPKSRPGEKPQLEPTPPPPRPVSPRSSLRRKNALLRRTLTTGLTKDRPLSSFSEDLEHTFDKIQTSYQYNSTQPLRTSSKRPKIASHKYSLSEPLMNNNEYYDFDFS